MFMNDEKIQCDLKFLSENSLDMYIFLCMNYNTDNRVFAYYASYKIFLFLE